MPPHSDVAPPDIKEGYWLSFAPAFPVTKVLRDFPFGVEATKNPDFHALTFVDLLGKDEGLLVLHPGTQWFRRDDGGPDLEPGDARVGIAFHRGIRLADLCRVPASP